MKLLFLLAIIPIFFCLNSVLATDITSCTNITTSGYYQFTENITTTGCNFGYGCILINASSVTLDLKHYSLINNASCSYGIVILPKNVTDLSDRLSSITITNGNLIDFVSVSLEVVGSIEDSSFTYLNFYGTMGVGHGIGLTSGYDQNILIAGNLFNEVNNAVIGDCFSNCQLYQNKIHYATNGFYLQKSGWDIQRNEFGFYTKNIDECFKDDYPIESGIYCNNCTNSIIKNNDIMGLNALTVENYGNHNNITNNIFRPFYEYEPIIKFGSTTSNNTFCNNQKIRVIPTSVYNYINSSWDCFYSTETTNAKGNVQDLDSNTIQELCTSNCQIGWSCSGTYRVYINSSCGIAESHTCERGCENDIYGSFCIGNETLTVTTTTTTTSIPMTDQYNISVNTPVINQTDLQEAGMQWMTPFFTPFFLIIMLEIIISSIIAWISKQAVTFPITIFLLSLMFGSMGFLSLFITAITCILTALLTAFMFKGMTSD
jgi:hypothetical protein